MPAANPYLVKNPMPPQDMRTYGYGPEYSFFQPASLDELLQGFTPQPNAAGQPQEDEDDGASPAAAAAALLAGPAIGAANSLSKLITDKSIGQNIVSGAKELGSALGIGGGGATAAGVDAAAMPAGMLGDLAGPTGGVAGGGGAGGGGLIGPAGADLEGVNAYLGIGGEAEGLAAPAGGWEGAAGAEGGVSDAIASLMAGGGEGAAGAITGMGATGAIEGFGGTALASAAEAAAGPALAGANWGAFSAIPAVGMAALAAFIVYSAMQNTDVPEEHATMTYDPKTGQPTFGSTAFEGGSKENAAKMQASLQSGLGNTDFGFYEGQTDPLNVTIFSRMGKFMPTVLGGQVAQSTGGSAGGEGGDTQVDFRQYQGGITPEGTLADYQPEYATFEEAQAAVQRYLQNPTMANYDYMMQQQQQNQYDARA